LKHEKVRLGRKKTPKKGMDTENAERPCGLSKKQGTVKKGDHKKHGPRRGREKYESLTKRRVRLEKQREKKEKEREAEYTNLFEKLRKMRVANLWGAGGQKLGENGCTKTQNQFKGRGGRPTTIGTLNKRRGWKVFYTGPVGGGSINRKSKKE